MVNILIDLIDLTDDFDKDLMTFIFAEQEQYAILSAF